MKPRYAFPILSRISTDQPRAMVCFRLHCCRLYCCRMPRPVTTGGPRRVSSAPSHYPSSEDTWISQHGRSRKKSFKPEFIFNLPTRGGVASDEACDASGPPANSRLKIPSSNASPLPWLTLVGFAPSPDVCLNCSRLPIDQIITSQNQHHDSHLHLPFSYLSVFVCALSNS